MLVRIIQEYLSGYYRNAVRVFQESPSYSGHAVYKKRKNVPDQSFALSPHIMQHLGCHARKQSLHLPCVHNDMIREKAIFIKLNQLKLSDQQIFDAVVNGFKPSRCICPVCKAAGRFKEILPYRRCMISVCDGARTEAVVNISRFQCESCGHTHTSSLV